MTGLLLLFELFLALGLFFLAASILRLPTIGTAKAVFRNVKQEKEAAKTIETYLMTVAMWLVKYIYMDEYKRSRTHNVLKTSSMNPTPETYQAYAFVKAEVILLGVIPCASLLSLLSLVIVILPLPTYLKESQKADERPKAKRDKIEGELPRSAATIGQELKTSRSTTGILERLKGNAGAALIRELDILLADMRSSNYETALTRFEVRLNSPMLSDVVWELIGVLRGGDGPVCFQVPAHDSKQLELQRLKARAQKIPPKIGVFPFAISMYLLLTYPVITTYVTVTGLGEMFQERREAVRLREQVESRPQSSFGMMTSSGYVFLTPKQAKELLEGKGMRAYLGISGYDITVPTEEPLAQNMVNVKWGGAVCHMSTDYIQKKEPEPPAPGQGAVMC